VNRRHLGVKDYKLSICNAFSLFVEEVKVGCTARVQRRAASEEKRHQRAEVLISSDLSHTSGSEDWQGRQKIWPVVTLPIWTARGVNSGLQGRKQRLTAWATWEGRVRLQRESQGCDKPWKQRICLGEALLLRSISGKYTDRTEHSHSAGQEIPLLLCNPMVHYRVHNSPPLVPFLSHMHPVHTFPPYLTKIYSNIILQCMPRSFHQSFVFISHLLYACYMLQPSHPNIIRRSVQVMKLLVTQPRRTLGGEGNEETTE
jgi:hypothetical protein